MKSTITLAELEAAINFWRSQSPSTGEERALCAQAAALAKPYALMIVERLSSIDCKDMGADAQEALEAWATQTSPD